MADHDEFKVKVCRWGPGRPLALRWTDPTTGKRVAKSAGTTDEREAERQAAILQAELNSGNDQRPSRVTWAEFRRRYEAEKLPSLAPRTAEAVASAFNHLEQFIGPDKLCKVTTAALSRLAAKLRGRGLAEATVAANLRTIRAALGWAVAVGLLQKAPDTRGVMPKRGKGQKMMRGRPLVGEEFDRLLAVVPRVRPDDAPKWSHYLTGLWLSGLRLEESTVLSWDFDAPFAVDLSGRHPRFRILAEAEKGHRDRYLPMTPDFAQWLLQTPEAERHGRVFKLTSLRTGEPLSASRTGRIVRKIGEKARVVVDQRTKRSRKTGKAQAAPKYAGPHDLRRSYGTRWAKRVSPAVLQTLMRHQNISTTMAYYVAFNSDELAGELWADWGNAPAVGNNRGNTGPAETEHAARASGVTAGENPCGESGCDVKSERVDEGT